MFVLETPGGGGWGCPDDKQSAEKRSRDMTSRDKFPIDKFPRVEVKGSVAQYVRNQESA